MTQQEKLSRPGPTTVRRGESGSAYMIALLALVVVTIIGMSLVLVTGTEVQMGSTERRLTRTFYNADAGISIGLANLLNNRSTQQIVATLANTPEDLPKVEEIDVGCMVPVARYYCNLCSTNNGNNFYNMNYLVQSTATRYGVVAGTTERHQLARQNVDANLQIEPTQPPELHDYCVEAQRRRAASLRYQTNGNRLEIATRPDSPPSP